MTTIKKKGKHTPGLVDIFPCGCICQEIDGGYIHNVNPLCVFDNKHHATIKGYFYQFNWDKRPKVSWVEKRLKAESALLKAKSEAEGR